MRRAAAIGVTALALVAGGCSEDTGALNGEPSSSGDLVLDYCSYGAVSDAQLDGCVDHVTEDQVDALDTNAARYARGELQECLEDAGPFCEER
ncbi:MAG TPA: hypothetical protein VF712_10780 [Thermoleophilaceae bacterium]